MPATTHPLRGWSGGKASSDNTQPMRRLPDTLRDHRARLESFAAFADGKITVADAAEAYLHKVRASVSLKPRSKEYREMMIDFIRRSWPSLFATDVRKVTQRDCETWLSRYQQQYAPSVVNNSIGTLRAIFDELSHSRGVATPHNSGTAWLGNQVFTNRAHA